MIYIRHNLYLQVKRLKNDLANDYNRDIERLKLEQESLKAQVEAEVAKRNKIKIKNKKVCNINIFSFANLKLMNSNIL